MRSLLRLLPWTRPYRWRFTVGLASVAVSTALFSLIPTLLRRAIDRLGQPEPWVPVLEIAGLMLMVTLTMAVFRFTMREILNGVSRVIENDLRDALFARLTTLDGAWFGRTRTGEIMARLTNDLTAVRMAVGPAVMYLTNTIFGGLFALGFMVAISPRLTGLALIPMLLLPLVMFRLGRVTHDRFERVQSTFGDLTTLVQEHLAGIRIVRAYAQEQAERARFAELSEEYLDRNRALVRLNGLMNPAFTLLAGLGAAVVLGVGGAMVLEGALTIGTFVAFGLYLSNLTWPLIALGWVTNLFQRGAASWGRIEAILDAHPTITDPVAPRVAAVLPHATAGRTITFDGVSFAYPDASGAMGRTVLREITLTILAGTTLGVVGATGSGKSALLELLPRLADPTAGVIRLDGIDLRDLPLATLRAEIGFVPQESLLFSETIRENLHFGTEDDDAVREATRVAQLAETIAGFPQGEQTMLGERGVNLSGGQRQRAALARALARRPNVVILDDALAAVDTQTEAAILRELRTALAGRTAIVASHRITAVREAQWIIVLDEGRIVEQGRHDELVAAGGRYAALLERQRLEESLEAA
ncbi:MAG: ABC transporter ATP-binding protein [Gemmatimonadetes bacterium]|nr:ABC transporter ATP-binding protein [Gemmatimonadota bacterium]MBM4191114.1 ABC transporter ATP-binding protein [Gemmatimonadota bacterium]